MAILQKEPLLLFLSPDYCRQSSEYSEACSHGQENEDGDVEAADAGEADGQLYELETRKIGVLRERVS